MTRDAITIRAWTLILFLGFSATAHAFDQPKFKKAKSVALLPVKDFRPAAQELFYDKPAHFESDAVLNKIREFIVDRLSGEYEIVVFSNDSLRERLNSHVKQQEGAIIARGYLHLGIEQYKNLYVSEGVKNLEKGEIIALDAYLDILEPAIMADLFLHKGLSYMEIGNLGLAHISFRNMFFVDPSKRFQKGYYPRNIEQAIESAFLDFNKTFVKDNPLLNAERMEKLLKDGIFESLIYIYISSEEGVDHLNIRIFDRKLKGTAYAKSLSLERDADYIDFLDRAISAWLTCTDLESRILKVPEKKKYFLDTVATHSIYLKYPTRRIFNNLGFGVNFSTQVTENLDIFTKVNLFTSIPDKYKDLFDNFNSFRGVVGGGLTIWESWGKLFFHTGIDVHYLGNFVVLTDPDCKFLGQSHPYCDVQSIEKLDVLLLLGINISVGGNIKVFKNIYAAFQAGISSYFYPFRERILLNFPLNFELGLGYMF